MVWYNLSQHARLVTNLALFVIQFNNEQNIICPEQCFD